MTNYKVWFTETISWYADIADAATPAEARSMVLDGDERVWDNRDYIESTITVDHMEEY